jgi:hypothetical protein
METAKMAINKRDVAALQLRALAMLIERQAFPELREEDANFEERTHQMTTELLGLAQQVGEKREAVAE